MQDHPIGGPPMSEEAQDHAVLDLLLRQQGSPMWSSDELAAEVGDRFNVADALQRLSAAGLVHRLDRFAFPTRSAIRFEQLAN